MFREVDWNENTPMKNSVIRALWFPAFRKRSFGIRSGHCRGFFTPLEVKPQQRCAVACADRALVAEIDFQSALFVRSAVAGRVDVQSFLLDVSEKPAEPAVAAALQVATGIPVICLDQVRGWEGRPVLQSQSWFHPRLNLSGHTNGTK
jgi:UTRA domain